MGSHRQGRGAEVGGRALTRASTPRRLLLVAVLAALASGCQTPPMPSELSDALDGSRVRLLQEQELVINLDGNQTTGFRWVLVRGGAPVVVQVGDATYASRAPDGRLAGSGGVTTYKFKAAVPGDVQLVFNYRRPWEANIPPARTVRFDIRVEKQ